MHRNVVPGERLPVRRFRLHRTSKERTRGGGPPASRTQCRHLRSYPPDIASTRSTVLVAALRPGALVVLDDAGRREERSAIRRWLLTYVGLELVVYDPTFGRRGVAILQVKQSLTQRYSIRAWVGGAAHSGVAWLRRTAKGRRSGAPGHDPATA